MYLNRSQQSAVGSQQSGTRPFVGFVLISVFCVLATACGVRSDMQDQPRYKAYKKSDFFADGRGSRDRIDGTVARAEFGVREMYAALGLLGGGGCLRSRITTGSRRGDSNPGPHHYE